MKPIDTSINIKELVALQGQQITFSSESGAVTVKEDVVVRIASASLEDAVLGRQPSLQRTELNRDFHRIHVGNEALVIANLHAWLCIPYKEVPPNCSLGGLLQSARRDPEYGPYRRGGGISYTDSHDIIRERAEVSAAINSNGHCVINIRVWSQVILGEVTADG